MNEYKILVIVKAREGVAVSTIDYRCRSDADEAVRKIKANDSDGSAITIIPLY